MKSILKQALTVVLLLSVPAVFAADAKPATGVVANVKASASKAGKFVAGRSKAAYNFAANKTGRLYNWTINPNDTKLTRAGKLTLVGIVTAVAAYSLYKLPAAIKAVRNYMRNATTRVTSNVAPTVAKPAKTAAQKAEIARLQATIARGKSNAAGMKLDAHKQLELAAVAAAETELTSLLA